MNKIRQISRNQEPSITFRRHWPRYMTKKAKIRYQKDTETVRIETELFPFDSNREKYRKVSFNLNKRVTFEETKL